MSSPALLLDTHVWYHYQVDPDVLRTKALDAIDLAASQDAVFIAAISVWELAMLERDKKIALAGGSLAWCQTALSKPGITLLPFSPEIAVETVYLPAPMHKDPSDRTLVATARVEQLTLVTSDKAILRFAKHSGLPCIRA